jgi:hypothetical protein
MKAAALIAVTFCALTIVSSPASARDSSPQFQLGLTWPWHKAVIWPWHNRLRDDFNQLNRMRGHVRWQLHNYRSHTDVRRDFWRISKQIDQINAQYRQTHFDRTQLRSDIDRARSDLHQIEVALRVRSRDLFVWR